MFSWLLLPIGTETYKEETFVLTDINPNLMDNLQAVTSASQYRKKYLALLKRTNISKADVRGFGRAVDHYKTVFPDWRDFKLKS